LGNWAVAGGGERGGLVATDLLVITRMLIFQTADFGCATKYLYPPKIEQLPISILEKNGATMSTTSFCIGTVDTWHLSIQPSYNGKFCHRCQPSVITILCPFFFPQFSKSPISILTILFCVGSHYTKGVEESLLNN
jgi:hypothetical protein